MTENSTGSRVFNIQKQRLCEQIVHQIEQDIIGGHLSPGEALPAEKVLVTQFGVSRTVIREAINKLTTKGLIRVTHGKGAVVAPKKDWNVIDAGLLKGLGNSLPELLELRKILEVEAAGLAAERATDDDLQAIGQAIQRYEATLGDAEKRLMADIDFHAAIINATKNNLLAVVLEPVAELLRSSRMATLGAPSGMEKSRVAHARIWDALQKKDAIQARRAMRQHLDEVAADFKAVGIQ